MWANLVGAFEYLETCNRKILNHGWVNFPVAYTQVCTLSVFAYFGASLLGAQYLYPPADMADNSTFPSVTQFYNTTGQPFRTYFSTKEPFIKHTPDLYFPVFTVLEFIGRTFTEYQTDFKIRVFVVSVFLKAQMKTQIKDIVVPELKLG